MASIQRGLAAVKEGLVELIDEDAVLAACDACGHEFRRRRLDPAEALRLQATQIAHQYTAASHLIRIVDGDFCESAYCQARQRVPLEASRAAFDAFNARIDALQDNSDLVWCGRRTLLVDGSGFSLPDTPGLRAAFGTKRGWDLGLPLAHAVIAFDGHDGRIRDLHIAPATVNDQRQMRELHPSLRPGDVVVGDRGFCSYCELFWLKDLGCDGVMRVSSSRSIPFPARTGVRRRRSYGRGRRSEPILQRLISVDDQIIEIVKPRNRPPYISPECFAAVPGRMVVRAIRYRVERDGFRVREITLLTTLLDPARYPAAALAEVYHLRWCAETDIRSLKRTLGMDRLRCRDEQSVRKEILMFALVFNAVCAARARAARKSGVPPRELSFIDTLRALVAAQRGCLRTTRLQSTPRTLPRRDPRWHPRKLKRRNSDYAVLKCTRAEVVRWWKEQWLN